MEIFNIHNHAERQFAKHPFSKEWKAGIITFALIKVFTQAISIYAGFAYMQSLVRGIFNPTAAAAIAAAALLLLELLTALILSKFWKFTFRADYRTAPPLAILAILIFALSFHISANGLAMSESEKADTAAQIREQAETSKAAIKTQFEEMRQALQDQANAIKENPQGWHQGQRTHLTSEQLAQLDTVNRRIIELQHQLRQQLASIESQAKADTEANRAEVTSEAERYYNVVAVIMALQFLANGALMFFWFRIYRTETPEDALMNDAQEVKEDFRDFLLSLLKDEIEEWKATTQRVLRSQNTETEQAEQAAKRIAKAKKTSQNAGFAVSALGTQADEPDAKNQTRDAEQVASFLQKHRALLSSIIEHAKTETITNQQIRVIASETNASNRSRSTIRAVHTAAKSYGWTNAQRLIES